MSIQLTVARATDAQKLKVAQFCVRKGLTNKDAIKAFWEPYRYVTKDGDMKISFSYTDVWYIVMGLTVSDNVPQPQEIGDVPSL